MRPPETPLALQAGNWFKLICGASYQHLNSVRNLSLVYTLAGADCIDVAADTAVIRAAQEGIETACKFGSQAKAQGFLYRNPPILMVSLNDGEDPHFRKAFFSPSYCPTDCPRPCESICPAQAIDDTGVLTEQCYGCGRCLPVCPSQLIQTQAFTASPAQIIPHLLSLDIQALEIHTQVGRLDAFARLWQLLAPHQTQLRVLAVSCPDGRDIDAYLLAIAQILRGFSGSLIWQTDGRSMSGDIGVGTTHATIKLASRVMTLNLPGYVQLAGGTNHYTVAKLKTQGLLKDTSEFSRPYVAGIAYGSYARALLMPILERLETIYPGCFELEKQPDLLWEAVTTASVLVSQLKNLDKC